MNKQPTLDERGAAAAKLFLERIGYTILAESWTDGQCRVVDFVAEAKGKLHLVDVYTRLSSQRSVLAPVGDADREIICDTARAWSKSDGIPFEYDVVEIVIVAEERAFILMHYDVISAMDYVAA